MSKRPRYEALAPGGARFVYGDVGRALADVHALGLRTGEVRGAPIASSIRWMFEAPIIDSALRESGLVELFRAVPLPDDPPRFRAGVEMPTFGARYLFRVSP